jgi:hypothetical protein
MRPRAIQSVPGLDPNGTPFGRLRQFAKMIVSVPKQELEKEIKKSGSAKNGAGLKKRKATNGKTSQENE